MRGTKVAEIVVLREVNEFHRSELAKQVPLIPHHDCPLSFSLELSGGTGRYAGMTWDISVTFSRRHPVEPPRVYVADTTRNACNAALPFLSLEDSNRLIMPMLRTDRWLPTTTIGGIIQELQQHIVDDSSEALRDERSLFLGLSSDLAQYCLTYVNVRSLGRLSACSKASCRVVGNESIWTELFFRNELISTTARLGSCNFSPVRVRLQNGRWEWQAAKAAYRRAFEFRAAVNGDYPLALDHATKRLLGHATMRCQLIAAVSNRLDELVAEVNNAVINRFADDVRLYAETLRNAEARLQRLHNSMHGSVCDDVAFRPSVHDWAQTHRDHWIEIIASFRETLAAGQRVDFMDSEGEWLAARLVATPMISRRMQLSNSEIPDNANIIHHHALAPVYEKLRSLEATFAAEHGHVSTAAAELPQLPAEMLPGANLETILPILPLALRVKVRNLIGKSGAALSEATSLRIKAHKLKLKLFPEESVSLSEAAARLPSRLSFRRSNLTAGAGKFTATFDGYECKWDETVMGYSLPTPHEFALQCLSQPRCPRWKPDFCDGFRIVPFRSRSNPQDGSMRSKESSSPQVQLQIRAPNFARRQIPREGGPMLVQYSMLPLLSFLVPTSVTLSVVVEEYLRLNGLTGLGLNPRWTAVFKISCGTNVLNSRLEKVAVDEQTTIGEAWAVQGTVPTTIPISELNLTNGVLLDIDGLETNSEDAFIGRIH